MHDECKPSTSALPVNEQADNQADIPEDSDEVKTAKEIIALVSATLQS